MSSNLTFSLHILLTLMGLLLLPGCQTKHEKKQVSSELKAFEDKYNQIDEEMTEEQVDAILTGYRSASSKEILEVDRGVKRKSAQTKTYFNSGLKEGDYIIQVHFDKDGYLVGKGLGALVK
jgi:hypothetical protein